MTYNLYTLGESMGVIQTPTGTLFESASTCQVSIGGAESNVAIGAARLGLDVMWVGRVGDDSLGRRITKELRGEGVHAQVTVDAVAPTGLLLKEMRSVEHTKVSYYRRGSAGSRLNVGDVHEWAIADSEVVHLTGITLALSDTARDAVRHAADLASRVGTALSFDINHRESLWGRDDARDEYTYIADRSSILFAGIDEARMIAPSGTTDNMLAARLSEKFRIPEVIIKRGADGADAVINGKYIEVAAYKVPVIDTVGAGDSFAAGYLAARAKGGAPVQWLETAAIVAGFVCMTPGDWGGAPRWSDVESANANEWVSR
ncbi:sugar kinase [Salinibacterium xinjiangense]|uniref:2-dehydro-3-deoxygluconokinase n=1 Tax=Salinibacterium xinjiangense TaxID=386302 RepID=A0A2C8Z625_9MICO|nr:sugar kinase [Salinibacterium xinjiangense]GGK92753.1 sugar kinase [Salinibacterium xinjiangense]SOE59254.1 2-dehydro-3-deoxygluconokinase [Salinibacterium xinjiangense]